MATRKSTNRKSTSNTRQSSRRTNGRASVSTNGDIRVVRIGRGDVEYVTMPIARFVEILSVDKRAPGLLKVAVGPFTMPLTTAAEVFSDADITIPLFRRQGVLFRTPRGALRNIRVNFPPTVHPDSGDAQRFARAVSAKIAELIRPHLENATVVETNRADSVLNQFLGGEETDVDADVEVEADSDLPL